MPAEFAGYPKGLRAGQIPGVKVVRQRGRAGDRRRPVPRHLRQAPAPARLRVRAVERHHARPDLPAHQRPGDREPAVAQGQPHRQADRGGQVRRADHRGALLVRPDPPADGRRATAKWPTTCGIEGPAQGPGRRRVGAAEREGVRPAEVARRSRLCRPPRLRSANRLQWTIGRHSRPYDRAMRNRRRRQLSSACPGFHDACCDLSRRSLLKVGGLGLLGLTMPRLLRRRSSSPGRRTRARAAPRRSSPAPSRSSSSTSSAGPSHIDMFDMKPDAPEAGPRAAQADLVQRRRDPGLRAPAAGREDHGQGHAHPEHDPHHEEPQLGVVLRPHRARAADGRHPPEGHARPVPGVRLGRRRARARRRGDADVRLLPVPHPRRLGHAGPARQLPRQGARPVLLLAGPRRPRLRPAGAEPPGRPARRPARSSAASCSGSSTASRACSTTPPPPGAWTSITTRPWRC